jgi:hypothetical protein
MANFVRPYKTGEIVTSTYSMGSTVSASPGNVYDVFPYESWAALQLARAEERICSYCDSVFYPSKFHPGSCQECGAPIGRKT